MLCEIDYENVFFAKPMALPKASSKASNSSASTGWIKKAAILAIIASMSLVESISAICNNTIASQARASLAPANSQTLASKATDVAKETKLSNEVIVYGNKEDIKILFDLVADYPTL